jgi:UDP-N-acetylglucosamine--N-acetylmuramyl-(pentapeptide) pyrophosphoryl-undecaprenol N-acetylglucosamine transferase
MKMAVAGGGTGGHLFPGIAIAEEFLQRAPDNDVLFIGTSQGLEARVVPQLGLPLHIISVKGLKGKNLAGQLRSLLLLPGALLASRSCLRRFNADVVCGVGGYVSAPAVTAAVLQRTPAVIHEQNSFPGLSNRILGKYADRICVSYEESARFFPEQKTIFTGMPLRRMLREQRMPERDSVFTILVLGGSQGSREINAALAEAAPQLASVRERLRIIHQSGAADADMLAAIYGKYGLSARVVAFIDDMAAAYAEAHLVISRAGAATLAELAFCGRAALLIPYPHAANNHQEKNARVFVERGAAQLMLSRELTGQGLAHTVLRAEQHREQLQEMEQRARSLAKPEAAREIVDHCCALAIRKKDGLRP